MVAEAPVGGQNINNLVEVMRGHVQAANADLALHVLNSRTRDYDAVSYAELSRRAFAFGATLTERNLPPGSVCMIACYSPFTTLVAYYGAISVGIIPMIFPMPKALGSHDALIERIQHWGAVFERLPALVLEQGLTEKFHEFIPEDMPVFRLPVDATDSWESRDAPALDHHAGRGDVAFYQTTSSSTGDHKAVAISHGNILDNTLRIRQAAAMDDAERMATWLPLFHDMGLVGTVLFCFCNAYPLWLMTPVQFVKRPLHWLQAMSDHRCTIATAPNFGYDYCSRLVSDEQAATLALGGVKHLFIGAEPIRVSTIQSFVEKFRTAGITEQTLRPAYGLAESTIISTITRPNEVARFALLERDSIALGEPVKVLAQAAFDDARLTEFDRGAGVAACSAGVPIEGMTLRLVDEEGNAVADGVTGEITLSGASVALGYVAGGEQAIEPFPAEGTRTGDLGVMLDDDLYVIERIKNVIIRNGENFMVSALEQHIANLLETSHEHVAVFETDIHDPTSEVVVLVERHGGLEGDAIDDFIASMPQEAYPIDRVLFSRARAIPRTTSGKKRHFYCRKLLQTGELDARQSIEVNAQRIVDAKQ